MKLLFKPIPKIPYDKFKSKLFDHTWIHYLFHCTYCIAKDNINKNYTFYNPSKWIEHHNELIKNNEHGSRN